MANGRTGASSVFIAFRRGAGDRTALAYYQAIRDAGGDALMEVSSAPDGMQRSATLRQIAARDVFLLTVAPRTLEPCAEPEDWLRAQLAHAAAHDRRIICSVSPRLGTEGMSAVLAAVGVPVAGWLAGASVVAAQPDALPGVDLDAHLSAPVSAGEIDLTDEDRRFAEVCRRTLDALPPVTSAQLLAQYALERANARPLDDTAGRIAAYDEAIAIDPGYAEAYARRGANRDLLGDLDGARQDLTTAVRFDPELDIAHFNLGMLYAGQRSLDEARRAFDEAILLNPGLAQAYYQRGLIRAQIGDLAGAIADHSAVIALNPRSSAAYFHRGMAHAKHGPDFAAAIADWGEAIRLNPGFLEAHYNRGLVRANLGDLPGTLEDMQRVLALIPDQNSPFARQVQATLDDIRRRMEAG